MIQAAATFPPSPHWDVSTGAGITSTGLMWCCKTFLVFLPELGELFIISTLSREQPVYFQSICERSDRRSICPSSLKFVLDIIVWCFAQRLPQSDLQGHEGPHCHMEKNLPHVPQFIQIHVGQTDECECQEGLTVPPDGVVCKQVALKGERQRRT